MTPSRQMCGLMLAGITAMTAANASQQGNVTATKPFTFAVVGDNRGDDSGQQPGAFIEVLQQLEKERPALILDSGDMIYGHSSDSTKIEEEWRIYRQTVAGVRAPIYHVPGNHDLWDEASGRQYRDMWGPTYFAFTYSNTRFIGLDTETAPGRIDQTQFAWLQHELQDCAQPNIFLFLHRPLFPVDGAIGSSLDEFPVERDRLHNLFRQHADKIRAVFAGHEHLFNYQEREGIRYYISGGAGAPLYTAPELGGFHHYLTVHVSGTKTDVQLHKVCAPAGRQSKARIIRTAEMLEQWKQGLLFYAWDHSASVELTERYASQGKRGLRLNFDLAQYAWPVLVLPFGSARDWQDCHTISMDVYVPKELPGGLSLTTAVQGSAKHEAQPIKLSRGWNTISARLDNSWLPSSERGAIEGLEWSLSAANPKGRGYLVFDNLQLERQQPGQAPKTELLEGWERPLLWRVFDETVRGEASPRGATVGQEGLCLHLDWSKCSRPVVFAQLKPPWDLRRAKGLMLQAAAESAPTDLSLGLVFSSKQVRFAAAPLSLKNGANKLYFPLQENWLPSHVRTAVDQIAFNLVTTNTSGGMELTLQRLDSSGEVQR